MVEAVVNRNEPLMPGRINTKQAPRVCVLRQRATVGIIRRILEDTVREGI